MADAPPVPSISRISPLQKARRRVSELEAAEAAHAAAEAVAAAQARAQAEAQAVATAAAEAAAEAEAASAAGAAQVARAAASPPVPPPPVPPPPVRTERSPSPKPTTPARLTPAPAAPEASSGHYPAATGTGTAATTAQSPSPEDRREAYPAAPVPGDITGLPSGAPTRFPPVSTQTSPALGPFSSSAALDQQQQSQRQHQPQISNGAPVLHADNVRAEASPSGRPFAPIITTPLTSATPSPAPRNREQDVPTSAASGDAAMTSGIGLGRASTLSRGPTTRISSPPPPDTSPVQFEHPPPWVELAKVVEQQPQSAAALAVVVLALTIGWIGWRTFIYISLLVAGPLAVWFVFPRAAERPPLDEWPPAASDHDSVAWVNHALRSLFPLVSTDLLRPFVDLLEDALMTQVPPVVTSVRLSGVSLGIEPVLLTAMRPISDEEWFASLAEADKPLPNSPPKEQPASKAPTPPPKEMPRRASTAAVALSPPNLTSNPSYKNVPSPVITPVGPSSRSGSVNSRGSRLSRHSSTEASPPHSADVTNQDRLRKQDRLLAHLKRHRRDDRDASGTSSPHLCGDRDLDADHYVNYEVAFSYRRSADMRKHGSGLHMIAHFGWGVRGVGGSEFPVYLDVVELHGRMRVRVLLSAGPPFASEVSFSFVNMPYFDISARPLRAGSFNAMDIPLLKSYIEKSIAKVAAGFIAPKSYTLDVDRLLLGHESVLQTETMGVFRIVIHSASNLPHTDAIGSCDPYVAVSYSKFHKPLFSTRTIVATTEPVWEEESYILVPADAIATGEKLRLRVCDSDRFSADDLVGVVEVDVSELILQAQNQPTGVQQERHDVLQPGSPGMRVQGSLEWSVRFYPLWRMSDAELKKRADAAQVKRAEGCTPAPWWLQWLDRYVEVPAWEKERQLERKATMDRITGDRFRSEVEAAGKPTAELPSGVLQFHIHQCSDLELESLQGTFSGSGNRRKSAANGKPALQDIIDRGPTDNIDPPSTYCEVHLNDKFVYRTRTKQLTPVPYFNAVSERFIRDWREARIVFVVKDARDREHDPTLGIVNLQLKDVLRDRCQITHWYPLLGGLGWGRLRISLLFKPFDMHLPPNISSFETATFDLKGVSTTTDLLELCGGSRFPNLVIESEYDKAKLECVPDQSPVSAEEPYSDFGPGLAPAGPQRARTIASIRSTANASVGASRSKRERLFRRGDKDEVAQPHTGDVEWKAPHHVRLAVLYRPSCSLVFGFTLKRMIKKSKTYALATLRLKDVPDGEVATRTIPIFATSEIRDAMMAARQHDEAAKFAGGAENGQQVRVPSEHLGTHTPLVGYLTVSFVLHSGVSHAHRKLAKRDLRFRSVYRAWESIQIMYGREAVRLADSSDFDSDSDSDSDDNDDSEDNSEDDEAAVARRQLERDDTRHMLDEHDSHNHALHAKNRGIFQLKLVRTGKLVKDKAHAKILSSTTGRLDRRSRGMNHEVEHESQSKF